MILLKASLALCLFIPKSLPAAAILDGFGAFKATNKYGVTRGQLAVL